MQQPTPGDVFIGFHADTTASVILQVVRATPEELNDEEEFEIYKQKVNKFQDYL